MKRAERFYNRMKKKYGTDYPEFEMTKLERMVYEAMQRPPVGVFIEKYREQYGLSAGIVISKKWSLRGEERICGVIITKSAHTPGKYQQTRWDNAGLSGDTVFLTEVKAVEDALSGGYTIPGPEIYNEISIGENETANSK